MLKKIIVWILTVESKLILKKYKPFIVAVTGSVGKTSTKDAIFCILKNSEKHARKSEKSMNSEIGLPLTIIGVPNAWKSVGGWTENILTGLKLIVLKNEYPTCLILEVGADHPGDIKRVATWLKPDIAVITKISRTPVHVEFFKSPEEVFEEKVSLAENVKIGGNVILFADDEKIVSIIERVKVRNAQVITYGRSDIATVRGSNDAVLYEEIDGVKRPTGFTFKLDISGNSIPVIIQDSLGISTMYSLLAAGAVAKARNVSSGTIVRSVGEYMQPHGRMNIIRGLHGSTLIDDTYNSSPDAVVAALDTIERLETGGRKIVVLGDMMELGKHSGDEHRRIGKEVVGKVDMLVTVGPRSKMVAETAVINGLDASKVKILDVSTEVASYLAPQLVAGDVVLLKGSQSTRMERATKELMLEPEKAGELLVRQEEEWEGR